MPLDYCRIPGKSFSSLANVESVKNTLSNIGIFPPLLKSFYNGLFAQIFAKKRNNKWYLEESKLRGFLSLNAMTVECSGISYEYSTEFTDEKGIFHTYEIRRDVFYHDNQILEVPFEAIVIELFSSRKNDELQNVDLNSNDTRGCYLCFENTTNCTAANEGNLRFEGVLSCGEAVKSICGEFALFDYVGERYYYRIVGDDADNLYVRVTIYRGLRENLYGTIKLEEFLKTIHEKNIEKLANCTFDSLEKEKSKHQK